MHESDVMFYFQYTPETRVYKLYRFCPTCSINMRGELGGDWHVIKRGYGYIFAYREKDYALFTWREEY